MNDLALHPFLNDRKELQSEAKESYAQSRAPLQKALPPSFERTRARSYMDFALEKSARRQQRRAPHAPGEVAGHLEPEIGHADVGYVWTVWDYLTLLGLVMIVLGLLVPILSKNKVLTVLVPVGAAVVASSGFRSRATPVQ